MSDSSLQVPYHLCSRWTFAHHSGQFNSFRQVRPPPAVSPSPLMPLTAGTLPRSFVRLRSHRAARGTSTARTSSTKSSQQSVLTPPRATINVPLRSISPSSVQETRRKRPRTTLSCSGIDVPRNSSACRNSLASWGPRLDSIEARRGGALDGVEIDWACPTSDRLSVENHDDILCSSSCVPIGGGHGIIGSWPRVVRPSELERPRTQAVHSNEVSKIAGARSSRASLPFKKHEPRPVIL